MGATVQSSRSQSRLCLRITLGYTWVQSKRDTRILRPNSQETQILLVSGEDQALVFLKFSSVLCELLTITYVPGHQKLFLMYNNL